MDKIPAGLLIALVVAGVAVLLLRRRQGSALGGDGPVAPGNPGTPDKTAQNPKAVPWTQGGDLYA